MAKTCPDMKEVLRVGIQSERTAKEFYRDWAANAGEEHIKKELLAHAEEEEAQEKELIAYYEKLYEEKFEVDPNLIVLPELQVHTRDFGDVTSVYRVASAAYLSEMRAVEYYREMVENTEECEAQLMFKRLLDMEKEHMARAKRRYLKLREDVVGFHAF